VAPFRFRRRPEEDRVVELEPLLHRHRVPKAGNRAASKRFGQGCQMVYFQAKNLNSGKFWRALDWKMFVCFKVI
jgi:hypothetical protein